VTVNCTHCGGRSKVMETRQHVQTDWTKRGRPRQRHNVIRLRQCLSDKCRWRWRTIERIYNAKSKEAQARPARSTLPQVRRKQPGPEDFPRGPSSYRP
jgi:hypothetical protein